MIRARYKNTNVFAAEQMHDDIYTLLAIIERQDALLSVSKRSFVVNPLPGQHEMILREDGEPF